MYHIPTLSPVFPKTFGKCLGNYAPSQSYLIGSKNVQKEPLSHELIESVGKKLPCHGRLSVRSDGYIYLDIDNRFIHNSLALLNKSSVKAPPYFSEGFMDGAHISVALPAEEKRLFSFPGSSLSFSFALNGAYIAEIKDWEDFAKAWFFTVSSPELELFRENLGLNKKLAGEDFYITFGVGKRFLTLTEMLKNRQHLCLPKRNQEPKQPKELQEEQEK